MNKISNCPVCGRLYVDMGLKMCRDCYEKEKEQEAVVARYVRDNPKSTVFEICEATTVKEKIVYRMIREGRFIESGVEVSYPCELCGTSIARGRLCNKCKDNVLKQLQEQEAKNAVLKDRQKGPSGKGMYSKNMGIDGHQH